MKKTVSFILSAVMVISLLYFPTYSAEDGSSVRFDCEENLSVLSGEADVILGDLNGDGKIKSNDKTCLVQLLAGYAEESEFIMFGENLADINGDLSINSRDIQRLTGILAGFYESQVKTVGCPLSFDSAKKSAVVEAANGKLTFKINLSELCDTPSYMSYHIKSEFDAEGTLTVDGETVSKIYAKNDGAYHGAIFKIPNAKKAEISFENATGKLYIDSVAASSGAETSERAASVRENVLNGSSSGASFRPVEISDISMLSNPHSTSMINSKGNVRLNPTGTNADPYVTLNLEGRGLSADVYKYLVYVYMLPANNPTSAPTGEFFLCAGDTKVATAGKSVQYSMTKSGKYVSVILDLSSLDYWNGEIHSLRLDYFTGGQARDYCYVNSIIFCKTASVATSCATRYVAFANGTASAPVSSEAVKNTYFASAPTDSNSTIYLDGDVLCLTGGTPDRLVKDKIEERIAASASAVTNTSVKAEITDGWERLYSDYAADETARQGITCKISTGVDCYMKYQPLDVTVKEMIFDNDLGSDCDDGGATAMMVKAHRDGYCKMLAITSCVYNPWTPRAIKKISDYFGVYDIEFGENRDRDTLDEYYWYACTKAPAEKYYAGEEYPEFESNVALIRRLLANSRGNVTFVSTGSLATVMALLESSSDSNSSLDGTALFKEKVGHYVCGGGVFPGGTQENNFLMDPEAVDMSINVYLKGFPVTFVGAEVSGQARSGRCLAGKTDYILRDIYLNCSSAVSNNFESKGYWSWDQGVVYYALHGTGDGHFGVKSGYTVVPHSSGGTLSLYNNGGCHEYVVRISSYTTLAAIYDSQMVP